MNNTILKQKIEQNILKKFEYLMEMQAQKDKGKFYLEDDDKALNASASKKKLDDIDIKDTELDNTLLTNDNEKDDSDVMLPKQLKDKNNKTPLNKVDEILASINLDEIDNDTKVELIETIINSLQLSSETDDEFSDYMNRILNIIDSYKFEKEESEEEEEYELEDEEELENEEEEEKAEEEEEELKK